MTDAPNGTTKAASPAGWLVRPAVRQQAAVRLFCLPYAGSGAAAYHPWQPLLPPWVELVIVQLPGREQRLREQPVTRIADAVAAITDAMAELLDRPYALFGHSMGALIAFEVARALRSADAPPPACLLVSGRRAPQLAEQEPPIHALADGPFVGALMRRYNAIPRQLLEDVELLRLFLPALRADVELLETYSYTPAPPLDYPILAMGGLEDTRAPLEYLMDWQLQTKAPLTVRQFPGGHFYINTTRAELLSALVAMLAGYAPASAPAPASHERSTT